MQCFDGGCDEITRVQLELRPLALALPRDERAESGTARGQRAAHS